MNRYGIRLLLSALVLTLSHISALAAVVIHVSPDGDDANDGLTWATARRSIGAAIFAAPSDPLTPTRVFIREGVYQEWLTIDSKNKLELYGGFSGTEDTSAFDPETNDNRSGGETVIDGQLLSQCVNVVRSAGVRMDHVTLSRGARHGFGGALNIDQCADFLAQSVKILDSRPYYGHSGGGAYATNSSVTFRDVLVERCSTASRGGGVYAVSGSYYFERVTVRNCTAHEGAGLVVSGANAGWICDSLIEENSVSLDSPGHGGGLWIRGGNGFTVERSVLRANQADYGTGILITDNAIATISNTLVVGNGKSDLGNGAIAVLGYCQVSIRSCTIADNAGLVCSALAVPDTATVNLSYDIVAHNYSNLAAIVVGVRASLVWTLSATWANLPATFDSGRGQSAGVAEIDPSFVTRAEHWRGRAEAYHLRPASAVRDVGGDQGVDVRDLIGGGRCMVRVNGTGRTDLGALEHQGDLIWVRPSVYRGNLEGLRTRFVLLDGRGQTLFRGLLPLSPGDGFCEIHAGRFDEHDEWGPYSLTVKPSGLLSKVVMVQALGPEEANRLNLTLEDFVAGDADNDDKITVRDIVCIVMAMGQELVDESLPGEDLVPWPDIDGDGKVNVADLNWTLINWPPGGGE